MVLTMDSKEILETVLISKKILKESALNSEPNAYFQSDDNNLVEKDNQILSNTSSYVKQEQFSFPSIGVKKPYASSLSDVKAVTNSKKRPFTATNTKHETRLPQRKLPLGAIPNYMKNFKGIRRTNTIIDKKETIDKQTVDHFGMKPVCMKSHTKVKLKNISDGSFQDSITKINKFNLNYESLSNILVRDETNSKIQLVSVQSITIAVKDFLLESREGEGDQIIFNNSDIIQLTDKINHIFEKKAILMEHNSSEVLSKMPTENKIMLKKINDQYKKIYQLQVANKYLKKHKSEEIKILGKKLHLYRKKIKALKFTNELSFNKRTNFLKEKATIDNNKVRFDCLMKIIEKLKIELHTLFRTVQTDLRNTEQEKTFLNEVDKTRTDLEVTNRKHVCLKLNNKSLFDERTMSEVIKSNSKRNEIEDIQATLAQLSHKYTTLKSKMVNELHKNATQMNLLDLRGEIIRNMQDNDEYHKMRIISLLKDIEFEKNKSKEFVKMKAAHQEELNNIFSTITETQHRNTHLEAELHKHTISKQAQKKNLSVRK